MKLNVIGWIVFILITVFLGKSCYDNHLEKEVGRTLKIQNEKRIKSNNTENISKFIKLYDPVVNWGKYLKGYKRSSQIFTYDLEKLWIGSKPIIFKGELIDIESSSKSTYKITIQDHVMVSRNANLFIDSPIRLSLISNKTIIDVLIKNNPKIKNEWKNGVIVVANIDSVKAEHITNSNDQIVEMKMGYGELIDISYAENFY